MSRPRCFEIPCRNLETRVFGLPPTRVSVLALIRRWCGALAVSFLA